MKLDLTKGINWGPALFLIIYHVILLIALPIYFYYNTPSWGIWIAGVALLYLTGIGITGGYHRYYAHKTYKTHPIVEAVILFFSSMSAQGSALRWSFEHRLHHAHVDTEQDPYSIKKGFWYAHCLWLLEKPKPIDSKVVPDLMRNPWVMLQHNHYELSMVLTNAISCLFFGWLFNDYWGAFIIVTWLRLLTLHHFTWFINSLAHTWGDKPFCQEQTAVNNFILAFLTFGEGYHNYHHTFANDYRNGIRWFHYDPTKWVIWTLHKLGLASGLKKVDPQTIRKRIVLERRNLLLETICKHWEQKKEELARQVDEISERMVEHMSRFAQLKERYKELKREAQEVDLLDEIRQELRALKRNLRNDWREWSKLSRNILSMKSQPA